MMIAYVIKFDDVQMTKKCCLGITEISDLIRLSNFFPCLSASLKIINNKANIFPPSLQANETWDDGPCRSCYCDPRSSTQGTCNKIECAAPPTSSEYVIVAHNRYGQCCPTYKKESCVFNGTMHEVGTEWSSFDPCTVMSCKLDNNGEAFTAMSVQSCNTECPLVSVEDF